MVADSGGPVSWAGGDGAVVKVVAGWRRMATRARVPACKLSPKIYAPWLIYSVIVKSHVLTSEFSIE